MAETIVEQAGFPFSVEPGFAEFESDADWRSREILSSLGRVANFERPNDAIYEIPEVQLPWAARVQDLSEEDKVQLDFAQGLGALVVGQAAERPSASSEPSVSIVDQLEWAANGDRAALEANVSLALVEAILSEGVNEVQIEFDQDGEFSQGGHRLYDVLKNTIEMRPGEHPVLHDTTRTEGLGLSTMKMLETEGYFDAGYVWIVPRMVPQGVPASALREYGYFENLAVSWGIVWKDEDGAFVTRTLFTAGANPEDHEESATRQMTDIELDAMIDARLERRHDIQAVGAMYEEWGLPVPTETSGFQRGVVLHKKLFKNQGEYDIDVVQGYDNQLGSEYFYGRKAARQDYVTRSRESICSMRDLDGKRDAVIDEMLNNPGATKDPMAMALLLAKTARKHAIDFVIEHPEVDASPLGLATVKMREEYQWQIVQGDRDRAEQTRQSIHRVARANMCGFGGSKSNETQEGDEDDAADEEEEESDEDCEFISEECPMCHKKKVRTVVTRTHIKGDCGCVVKK